MQITLYYAPFACSLVPYVALTEAGAEFEVTVVNFKQGMHLTDSYLRLNPKHAVPVLVIDGEPLTENVAILQWIAERYPGADLLPVEGLAKFRAIALLAWCASGIHPFLTPNVLPHRYCDIPGSEDGVRRSAHKMLAEKFAMAEDMLNGRDWFLERFTLVDAYFFWCFRRATLFKVDVAGFTHCQAHYARMLERPSVQQLTAFEAKTLAALEKSQ